MSCNLFYFIHIFTLPTVYNVKSLAAAPHCSPPPHSVTLLFQTQKAKYVERWPNTTSAWAGWSRFDIPVDRYGGVHSLLICTRSTVYWGLLPATRLAIRRILIQQNIKKRTGPAFWLLCVSNHPKAWELLTYHGLQYDVVPLRIPILIPCHIEYMRRRVLSWVISLVLSKWTNGDIPFCSNTQNRSALLHM